MVSDMSSWLDQHNQNLKACYEARLSGEKTGDIAKRLGLSEDGVRSAYAREVIDRKNRAAGDGYLYDPFIRGVASAIGDARGLANLANAVDQYGGAATAALQYVMDQLSPVARKEIQRLAPGARFEQVAAVATARPNFGAKSSRNAEMYAAWKRGETYAAISRQHGISSGRVAELCRAQERKARCYGSPPSGSALVDAFDWSGEPKS